MSEEDRKNDDLVWERRSSVYGKYTRRLIERDPNNQGISYFDQDLYMTRPEFVQYLKGILTGIRKFKEIRGILINFLGVNQK